jgi:hypothetical protein
MCANIRALAFYGKTIRRDDLQRPERPVARDVRHLCREKIPYRRPWEFGREIKLPAPLVWPGLACSAAYDAPASDMHFLVKLVSAAP